MYFGNVWVRHSGVILVQAWCVLHLVGVDTSTGRHSRKIVSHCRLELRAHNQVSVWISASRHTAHEVGEKLQWSVSGLDMRGIGHFRIGVVGTLHITSRKCPTRAGIVAMSTSTNDSTREKYSAWRTKTSSGHPVALFLYKVRGIVSCDGSRTALDSSLKKPARLFRGFNFT